MTKRLFVLGTQIGYSISPAMQNAAIRLLGLDWEYSLWDLAAEELPAAIAQLRQAECIGANVTIPHKEAVVPLLDGLGDSARELHAANTLVKRDGKLIGENTDGVGFTLALKDLQFDPKNTHVLILGAGGATRGVSFALARLGVARITLVNRTPARAETLAVELHQHFPQLQATANPAHLPADVALIVNALPPSAPVEAGTLPLARDVLAFDLSYYPIETPFLREARRTCARVTNGMGMLVYQGAESLRIWSGLEPDVPAMFRAAQEFLSEYTRRHA